MTQPSSPPSSRRAHSNSRPGFSVSMRRPARLRGARISVPSGSSLRTLTQTGIGGSTLRTADGHSFTSGHLLASAAGRLRLSATLYRSRTCVRSRSQIGLANARTPARNCARRVRHFIADGAGLRFRVCCGSPRRLLGHAGLVDRDPRLSADSRIPLVSEGLLNFWPKALDLPKQPLRVGLGISGCVCAGQGVIPPNVSRLASQVIAPDAAACNEEGSTDV